jgi:hypothetical protein|tara:strand:+ start:246 stop:428 length:183 start_codon:yes stop_codon:yes gene_type:complete
MIQGPPAIILDRQEAEVVLDVLRTPNALTSLMVPEMGIVKHLEHRIANYLQGLQGRYDNE